MKRFILLVVLGGCSAKTDGPKVEIASPSAGASLPLDPGLVCNEQLTTTVTVHGSGMSPMPIDLAGDARILLPSLTLDRTSTVTGEPTDPATALSMIARDRVTVRQVPGGHGEGDRPVWLDPARQIDGLCGSCDCVRRPAMPEFDARIEAVAGVAAKRRVNVEDDEGDG